MTPDLFQPLFDLAAALAPDEVLGHPLTEVLHLVGDFLHLAQAAARPAQPVRGRRPVRPVVEPAMTFITPGVTAAGIKATGSLGAALIGRYRPTGTPRLGSKEDRAGAYRRLLDATSRSFTYAYQFAHLQREASRAAHRLLLGQVTQQWEVASELIGALHGVRLCGSVSVIAAAESVVSAVSDLELNEKDAARFQRQAEAVVTAQGAFLDACREDLAYTARWWQLRRRRAERRLLAAHAER